MIYMVDIDGTICTNTFGSYNHALPFESRIAKLNALYDEGHSIHYWTSRGMNSGIDWTELTKQQLKDWGCKYTSFNMKKPMYDIWVDDKAMSERDFFR